MNLKISRLDDRFWLFSSLISFSILYLNLIWKTTENIDTLTTDGLFWGAILWLLWRKQNRLRYRSDFLSSCLGLGLIGIVLFKLITLFWFESIIISLMPIYFAFALALIASGFRGLRQYWQELFLALLLFFPSDALGYAINNFIQVKILTAKFATYFLYYFGFQVVNQGADILLSLPDLGEFRASVNYSCTGMTMIILMLKLALLAVCFFPVTKAQAMLIPSLSIGLGFILGVIRVCVLTLVLPNPTRFDYWHGDQGAQIFSTVGIMIFGAFCSWLLQHSKSSPHKSIKEVLENNSEASTNIDPSLPDRESVPTDLPKI